MKGIKLLFLTIGKWTLKNSNDNNLLYNQLQTKKNNEINLGYILPKKYIYDEINELLYEKNDKFKPIKCTIIEKEDKLSLINHTTNKYYIYKKEETKDVDLRIFIFVLFLMEVYQILMQRDTLVLLFSNIMRHNSM